MKNDTAEQERWRQEQTWPPGGPQRVDGLLPPAKDRKVDKQGNTSERCEFGLRSLRTAGGKAIERRQEQSTPENILQPEAVA